MYNEKVIDIFSKPKHAGELADANGIGTVGNASCGDIMKIYLKIDSSETITDASFLTFGCAAAIASSSMATDMIIGKTIEEALKVTNAQVLEALGGLPQHKVHCSILAEEAIQAAVADYRNSQNKG